MLVVKNATAGFRGRLLLAWVVVLSAIVVALVTADVVVLSRGVDTLRARSVAIVDPDGTVRMLMANSDRYPPPLFHGRVVAPRVGNQPGLVFYNADGTEQGALRWTSRRDGKSTSQFAALSFDQFEQNDQLIIAASDNNHERHAGVEGVEYVDDRSLPALIQELNRTMAAAPNAAARAKAKERYVRDHFHGARRFYIGYDLDASTIELGDRSGHARLRLGVAGSGAAVVQFLDAHGRITREIRGQ